MILLPAHPLLECAAFTTTFPQPLGASPAPPWLQDQLRIDAEAPFQSDDEIRKLVRGLLRQGGYRPTGRGKPASEYLIKAATAGSLNSINLAVDACNVVSLHSGLPISVIDLDRAAPPYEIRLGREGEEYVFNPSGQTIRIEGLLVLCDQDGPCANGVKDSQRTKTNEETRRTLSVIWGTQELPGKSAAAARWYRDLLERAGAETSAV